MADQHLGNTDRGDGAQPNKAVLNRFAQFNGAEPDEYPEWEHCEARLTASIAAYLRLIGEGDLERGIAIAAECHLDNNQRGK